MKGKGEMRKDRRRWDREWTGDGKWERNGKGSEYREGKGRKRGDEGQKRGYEGAGKGGGKGGNLSHPSVISKSRRL